MLTDIATVAVAVICDIGVGIIAFSLVAFFVVTVSSVVTYPMLMTIVIGNKVDAVTGVIALAILAERVISV